MIEDSTDEGVIAEATEDAEPIDTEVVDEPESLNDDLKPDEGDEGEEEELIEFNFGGHKLEVPKGSLPEGLESKVQEFSNNLWSDYTKGKQEFAESAKSIASEREALQNLQTMNQDMLDVYSQGLGIKNQIDQLSQVDVNQLWQTDPDRARQVSDKISGLQSELNGIIGHVDQYEQQIGETQSHEFNARKEAGIKEMDRLYKGFSTDIAPDVIKYVISKGMTEAESQEWSQNPRVTEMAYKAMLYDKMKSSPTKRVKVKQATVMAPVKSSGKASQAPSDTSKMSMVQYVKWRERG